MTATPQTLGGVERVGHESAIQTGLEVDLASSSTVLGENQFVTIDPTTGKADLNDGATPNQIGAGINARGKLTQNGPALLWQGQVRYLAQSTISGDTFAATDVAKPFWIANENTAGKKSNYGGSNRSLGGIFLQLFGGGDRLHVLGGVVGWLLGRAAHSADNANAGLVAYAVDATAATDRGSAADPVLIPREKRHGRITSIEIIPGADLAAAGTDYTNITIYKIDTLTNTVSAVIGTFTTLSQSLAKRVPTQFTLTATSALLDMLETDVLGYARLHTGNGAVVPQSIIRANMKVQ